MAKRLKREDLNEDQLNALLDQGVAYLMQQAQQMLGSRY